MISVCPRCKNEHFEQLSIMGIHVDRCSGCQGIWMDEGEYEKIIESSRQKNDVILDDVPPLEGLRIESYKPLRVLCPSCNLILLEPESVHFEFIHHYIAIDRCKHCNGVWLDDSELSLLFKYLKDEDNARDESARKELETIEVDTEMKQIYENKKPINRKAFFRTLVGLPPA
ncbi:hypothetical protein GF337_08950 [candidate division KSB1 bacterium]|nr:hypothetical protein [candidate division KSB1 bacterium]